MEYVRILRDLREDADKTQTQIAEVLGTSQTMYARYECGANELPIHHLITLSKYYGVSTDYLLGRETAPRSAATEEEIKFALFHGGPVTDAQYEEVKQFVRFIKERDANGGKP